MNPTDYIRSQGRGREARDLELQAMNDPLLADALDGFLAVEGNHLGAIDRLQKRIAEASAPRRALSLRILCGAAAVLLLGAAGVLLLLRPAPQIITPAKLQPLARTIPITPPAPQSVVTQSTPSIPHSSDSRQIKTTTIPLDPIMVVGFNAMSKSEFVGATSRKKPFAEAIGKQLQALLSPGKNHSAESHSTPDPLSADTPADPAVYELHFLEPESQDLCDRSGDSTDPLDSYYENLSDNPYGGG